jgi:hypothetical protein
VEVRVSEVWVVTTHHGHGESMTVAGLYESREAAWDAFAEMPNLTLYVDEHSHLRGRPRRDGPGDWPIWLHGRPMSVQQRVVVPA